MSTLLALTPEQVPGPGERRWLPRVAGGLLILNIDGTLHAVSDSCPHGGASLCNGLLQGGVLQCRAHGLRFDLRTGEIPGVPGLCLPIHPVERRDGTVYIRLDAADPGLSRHD